MSGSHYRAYLLRHWLLPDGQERVGVQQVATGERHRCHALAEATAWVAAHGQARAPDAPSSALTLHADVAFGANSTMDGTTNGATESPWPDTEMEDDYA